jgi:hypothetical protein
MSSEAGRPVREIDGARFDDLDGFWWGRNLDAFNDILRGGFGTPEGGFVLRWSSSERSRAVLGYEATVRWLEQKLESCHSRNVAAVRLELASAREARGPTLFDILLEIIRHHGPGGDEAEDGVDLELQ